MKYTLITTVLLTVLLAPVPGASADPVRDRADARQDRRDVRQGRREVRDDARDLEVLRDIQVELARARVESDAQAVAALDARVMDMLRADQREDRRGRRDARRDDRRDAAGEQRQNEARTRVASEWAQLDGRYERVDLERRVLLLDQLVDIARAESRQNESERREERGEIREDRRDGREGRRER